MNGASRRSNGRTYFFQNEKCYDPPGNAVQRLTSYRNGQAEIQGDFYQQKKRK